jgi:hypothetical protein
MIFKFFLQQIISLFEHVFSFLHSLLDIMIYLFLMLFKEWTNEVVIDLEAD